MKWEIRSKMTVKQKEEYDFRFDKKIDSWFINSILTMLLEILVITGVFGIIILIILLESVKFGYYINVILIIGLIGLIILAYCAFKLIYLLIKSNQWLKEQGLK